MNVIIVICFLSPGTCALTRLVNILYGQYHKAAAVGSQMRKDLQGKMLLSAEVRAHAVKLAEIEALLMSETAAKAARIGLFFGPSVAGYRAFVDAIGLDLNRALLAGHEISWTRPFVPDEKLRAELYLVDLTEKNGAEIGVVEARFIAQNGETIQTQRTTFIERAAR